MVALKALPYLLIAMASLTGGFFAGSNRATKIAETLQVPCPACSCPPAAVLHLAPEFNPEKFNNKKGSFEYSPTTEISNVTIVIDCADSVLLKKLVQKAK